MVADMLPLGTLQKKFAAMLTLGTFSNLSLVHCMLTLGTFLNLSLLLC